MADIIPWILSANTIVLMWLAGNKNIWAWILGLAGQVVWILFVILYEAWGLLPLCLALIYVYSRNLWKWRTKNISEKDYLDEDSNRDYRMGKDRY